MKKNPSLRVFLCAVLFLSFTVLLFTTCKRQNDANASIRNRVEKGDEEFITWHITRDSGVMAQQARTATSTNLTGPLCYWVGNVNTYGVTRTGSCATGYSYTLRLDDIQFGPVVGTTITATPPTVRVNGVAFTPVFNAVAGSYAHYSLSVPYSSFGVSDANFCTTDSLSITLSICGIGRLPGGSVTEVIKLTPSEACGSTNPDVTSTTAHYSYPPTMMNIPRAGSVDLGLLVNLCNTCTVRYPDYYVFQYRLTGTSTWTTETVAYPQYLLHTVSLPSGTYDLQGYNECAPGSNVPNNGPIVGGSPSTFTVL